MSEENKRILMKKAFEGVHRGVIQHGAAIGAFIKFDKPGHKELNDAGCEGANLPHEFIQARGLRLHQEIEVRVSLNQYGTEFVVSEIVSEGPFSSPNS